jgi:hypothetical protein
MSVAIVVALVVIVGALVVAGVLMLRGGGSSSDGRMMRALAVRIAVSVALFACILVAWRLGWIQPSGLPVGR